MKQQAFIRSTYPRSLHTTRLYVIGVVLSLLFLAACDRNAHEGEVIIPSGYGQLNVGLETEGTDIPVNVVHLFIFGANDKLQAHQYFGTPEEVALHATNLPSGRYTVIAVINVPADFMPPASRAALYAATRAEDLPDISLAEFNQWLSGEAAQHPEMLTGMEQTELQEGEVKQLIITIKEGMEGFTLPVLHLSLILPEPQLPDYVPTRAAEAGYALRCVVEVCRAGTDDIILHAPFTPTPATDGSGAYLLDLPLNANTYDLRLWTDYAPTSTPQEDTYYNTGNLKAITLTTEPAYTANTDAKDAAYACHTDIDLSAGDRTVDVQLQRPLAKYRLIATDVEEYKKLRATDETKFPPIEELTVTVQYENFFPASFNAVTGKPNDSYTGIAYAGCLTDAEGFDTATALQAGSDYVLTNGSESFVTATVKITDRTGNTVTATGGVQIPYRRGQLTTVKGNFLSSGHAGGGVQIDTEWEDDIIIRF